MAATPAQNPSPPPVHSPSAPLLDGDDEVDAWIAAMTAAVHAEGQGTAGSRVAAPPGQLAVVADAFGIDVAAARELPRFESSADAVSPAARSPRRPGYLPRREVDARLDPYRNDVGAGASDVLVAQRTGLRPGQVRRWRRRNDIVGVPGAKKTLAAAGFRFGLPPASLAASVAMHTTVTGGRFRAPTYVLRTPIEYDRLARVVVELRDAGMRSEFIASAIGIENRDVEQAYELAKRYGL